MSEKGTDVIKLQSVEDGGAINTIPALSPLVLKKIILAGSIQGI